MFVGLSYVVPLCIQLVLDAFEDLPRRRAQLLHHNRKKRSRCRLRNERRRSVPSLTRDRWLIIRRRYHATRLMARNALPKDGKNRKAQVRKARRHAMIDKKCTLGLHVNSSLITIRMSRPHRRHNTFLKRSTPTLTRGAAPQVHVPPLYPSRPARARPPGPMPARFPCFGTTSPARDRQIPRSFPCRPSAPQDA